MSDSTPGRAFDDLAVGAIEKALHTTTGAENLEVLHAAVRIIMNPAQPTHVKDRLLHAIVQVYPDLVPRSMTVLDAYNQDAGRPTEERLDTLMAVIEYGLTRPNADPELIERFLGLAKKVVHVLGEIIENPTTSKTDRAMVANMLRARSRDKRVPRAERDRASMVLAKAFPGGLVERPDLQDDGSAPTA